MPMMTLLRNVTFLLTMLLLCSAADRSVARITLTVRSNPAAAYETMADIDKSNIALPEKFEKLTFSPYLTDAYVTLTTGTKKRQFRLEQSGHLWDETASHRLVMPESMAKRLLQEAIILRRHHFGKIIEWEKAQQIISRKGIFSIRDLESGLTFRVQRRAGSDHADVQPLTKEDTSIMKKIFDGKWSWNRKAILAGSENNWLAASMNGMPHGGDGIPDNGFSGHFCVHFLNSTTHRSDEPDPIHQLMVHRAGGNLRAYFDSASPHQLAQGLIEAMNLHDAEMVRLILEGIPAGTADTLFRSLGPLASMRMLDSRETEYPNDSLFSAIELKTMTHYQGRKNQRTSFRFMFARQSVQFPWRIQDLVADPS